MGTGAGNPQRGLKTRCPRCGKEIEASSLSQLKRRVQSCCRPKRGRSKKGVPVLYTGPPLEPGFKATFSRLVESQNATTYSHWRVHYDDKKDWLTRVVDHFYKYRGVCLPWSRWSLRRIYAGRNRELDYANLVGGAKPLIDSLIDTGIIVDDAPAYFKCDYEQERGENNCTVLELLETKRET